MLTRKTLTLAAIVLSLAFTSQAMAFNPQPDPPAKTKLSTQTNVANHFVSPGPCKQKTSCPAH